ncbi:MAG: VCBS repeat-containing protein, partial [Candidatus Latescibacteria bacterium]|nr:VCBS repeat-containing protein [Candidatus Latescibacterota bacterium]
FDYNNDGLLDLLVGSPTIGEEFKLFHNRQSLFEDVTQEAGMMSSTMHGAAIGDYDNDGYVDLYLTRGTSINVLLRNRGDGTFEDVTLVAGVAALSGQDRGSSSFVDYDNDGDLDLFVGDYIGADMLFQNQGDGTFNNVAEDAGITGAHNTTHHMFGDYNNDGFMDLFIAHNDHNRSTPGILYRNEKNGRFTDVTLLADITESVAEAEGVLFMDFNNDGWLDLFITTGHHGPFGLSRIEENLLYRNSQSGTFSDVTRLMRVQGNTQSSGVMAGDYDNDGWADIFVSNSRFNHLFRNESGQVFARMDTQSGIVEEGGVGAVGFGDYNTDGFLDLFLASLKFQDNAGFETPGTDILYQNQGNPNNWIQVELVGIQSNRSGIGARLQVVANDLIMIREV